MDIDNDKIDEAVLALLSLTIHDGVRAWNTVWSVIRTGKDTKREFEDKYQEKLGQELTTYLREIADENALLKGIIDRVDFNATTHGVRDLDDDRLSNLIERISEKRLGLNDVELDIIGRSYEYLIRKFAEGSISSAGEFYTPKEVGMGNGVHPRSGHDRLRSVLRFRRSAHQVPVGSRRKDELALAQNVRTAPTLWPGVHAGNLGHGQHEHDHPRHAGPD